MSDVKLVEIPTAMVSSFWPLARPLVQQAVDYSSNRYDVPDVLELLLAERMQLWLVMEDNILHAIVIAEIADYPLVRECRILACIGKDAEHWVHLLDRIEEWALDHGCRRMVPIARPGWEKILKDKGYKKAHVQFEKEIGHVH